MGVGKGARFTLDFEICSKKGCFLSFEWKNQISPLLAPPLEKCRKNPLVLPPRKNLSDAHGFGIFVPCNLDSTVELNLSFAS